jgi:hypothetical protein
VVVSIMALKLPFARALKSAHSIDISSVPAA